MKTTLISALVVLTQMAPSFAQAAPQAAPPPPRFRVTLEAVEVSGDGTYSVTPGPEPAVGALEERLKKGGADMTEVSLVTPNDFAGSAEFNQVIGFTYDNKGKPTVGMLRVPTSLEALPHLNPDGTIKVGLKIMVAHTLPLAGSVIPSTVNQSLTTTKTFKDGGTLLLGGSTLSGQKQMLMFVTVRQILADHSTPDQARTFPGGQ